MTFERSFPSLFTDTPASLLSELEQSGVVISDEIDLQLNNNDITMKDNDASNNVST